MYRDQSFGTKTSELIPDSFVDSLSMVSIKRYMEYMGRFNPTVAYNRLSAVEFLQKVQVLVGEKVSYAGLLFFGKQDEILKHFADFRIDFLEIPGTSYQDASVRFTYRLVGGCCITQFQAKFSEKSGFKAED
jgi:hypothetical protein